jgi:hypothetical protein
MRYLGNAEKKSKHVTTQLVSERRFMTKEKESGKQNPSLSERKK